MLTTILSRADVSRHLQGLHLLKALRQGLQHRAQAGTDGFPGITARWSVSTCITAQGLRTLGQLYEPETGQVLAVMEADHLAKMQASVTNALATEILGKEEIQNVALIGCGTQASTALKALRLVRSLEQIKLFSSNSLGAFELAKYLQTTSSMAISAVDNAAESIADAELVVVTEGISLSEMTPVSAGSTVSLMYETAATPWPTANQHASRHFCAVREPGVDAVELGEILAGTQPGRLTANDVCVFRHGDNPLLNLFTAWHVWEGARNDESLIRVDLWRS